MCPLSWKLYVDDFPFFSSSLACLEPELELFEVLELMPILFFGVVKHLLQRIRNQGWRNDQYKKYILGGKEYNKNLGVLVSF